jgi:hypothetical protein
METRKHNKRKLPEGSSGPLAEAIAKLKDKVLFPEKVEKAKQYLSKAKMKTA